MRSPPSALWRFNGVEAVHRTWTRISPSEGATVSTSRISRGARGCAITTAGCLVGMEESIFLLNFEVCE